MSHAGDWPAKLSAKCHVNDVVFKCDKVPWWLGATYNCTMTGKQQDIDKVMPLLERMQEIADEHNKCEERGGSAD